MARAETGERRWEEEEEEKEEEEDRKSFMEGLLGLSEHLTKNQGNQGNYCLVRSPRRIQNGFMRTCAEFSSSLTVQDKGGADIKTNGSDWPRLLTLSAKKKHRPRTAIGVPLPPRREEMMFYSTGMVCRCRETVLGYIWFISGNPCIYT